MDRKLPFRIPRHYFYLAAVLIALAPASMGYMAYEAQTLGITVLHIDGAPDDIVFIADPHLKESNLDHVRNVIEEINRLEPSVVLIGGDFISDDADSMSIHEIWSEIEAPVYAVLGNHDYKVGIDGIGGMERRSAVSGAVCSAACYDMSCMKDDTVDFAYADMVEEELESTGMIVLRNEYVFLDINGQELLLVGVDDGWAGMADPPEVPETDAYTIYLIHEPECRADWDADLTLAGHTHGGQILLPIVGLLNDNEIVELSGMIENRDPPTYITRGVGSSSILGIDVRFNAPPEIVIINPTSPVL